MLAKEMTPLESAAKALRRNRFKVKVAATTAEARRVLLELVPKDATIGIGDSVTVKQIDGVGALEQRGNRVINPWSPECVADWSLRVQTMRATFQSDIFLTGCNAVTLDGKLVSTDMTGNRVAGTIFAAPRVVLVVGRNKIVADADAARERIRVLAPFHAATKGRKTPCAKTGVCTECRVPERLCNVTVIMEYKPLLTDVNIILVDDDLGLAWDPAWPEERINAVKEHYRGLTHRTHIPTAAGQSGDAVSY